MMQTFTLFIGFLLWAVSSTNHLVLGLELDAHLSAIWERNSEVIHDIAQKRACKDGRVPILTGLTSDEEGVTSYRLECEHSLEEAKRDGGALERRQTQTLCTSTCNRTCYHPADYNPDPKDCSKITESLRSGGGTFDVSVGGIQVSQYNTCIYTFTNQAHTTLNFCNSAWASIGDGIAWTCGRWLDDPAKGGICSATPFYVEAVRTPNMPGPSYTISFSTQAITRLDSVTSATPASSTSTSQSSSGTVSSISTTSASGTSSIPGPMTYLNVSGVVIQTISEDASMTLGQPDGNNVQGNSAQINVGGSPSNKQPDTAAAIGGAVGGVAFLALLIAVVLLYRRRRRQRAIVNDNSSAAFMTPMEHQQPWSIPASVTSSEKRQRNHSPPRFEPSFISPQTTGTPIDHSIPMDHSDFSSSVASQGPAYAYPAPHPRSTQALIAAAAPPNMSREQIDLLANNFISLVTGRRPQDAMTEDGDGSELPPYQRG